MPSYKLEPHGSVFVYTSSVPAPPSLRRRGQVLLRYMDRIFLPRKPSQLSAAEVRDANEVRLLLGPEVIDTKYTQQTLSEVYRRATRTRAGIRVLDFGCGDGNIVAQILTLPKTRRPADVVGVDICSYAVARAHERLRTANCGTAILIGDESAIDVEDACFDAVVANFVLHFPLSQAHASELFRILVPHGRLVYNDYLYARDAAHHAQVKALLETVGFRLKSSIERFGRSVGGRFETVDQAIVECVKPGPPNSP
jgi:ubiquinone/menaquinone biosynthesis C-methylase UbiE